MYDLSGYFTPVILFNIYQLIGLLKECGSVSAMLLRMNQFSKETKAVANHRWGNDYFRISDSYGNNFKFAIYKVTVPYGKPKNDLYDLSLWSLTEYSLGEHLYMKENDLAHNEKILGQAKDIMDRYTNGYVLCSACGKEHKLEDIKNNRYFAGVYCQACWDGKYKAIEAKENYN